MNIQTMHQNVDAALAQVVPKSAALGRPVTCRGVGCFACCKEPVLLSRQEARYIVDGILPEQLPHIVAQTRRWLTQVQASGLLQEPEPHVYLWRMMNAWCPLLQDGRCLAYTRRPVSCRLHLAIAAPEACEDDEARKRQRYAFTPEVNGDAMVAELEEFGEMEMNHLGAWLAEMLLGKKVKTPAHYTVRAQVVGEDMLVNISEMPELKKGVATRVAAK